MEQADQRKASWGWSIARLVFGALVPLPFLAVTLVFDGINSFYFPDEHDHVVFWLESMIYNGPAIMVGGLIMFLKFRSARVDPIATGIGAVLVVGTVIFLFGWVL